MNEATIIDLVRRSGISDEVLNNLYATHPDSPDRAVEQIAKYFEFKNYTIKTVCKRILPQIKKYLLNVGDFR